MDDKKRFISVCIISRPGEDIELCLNSIKNQTYKNKEIVLHREIGRFPELRNKVIDKAKGEIIAFIDSDCYAEKHWLEEINKVFHDTGIVGCFGKVCYELHGKMPTVSTRIISNDGEGTLTANASFRADILKKVRFDEEINSGEDIIINERLKRFGKIIYCNEAIIFHVAQKWNFKSIIKHAKKYIDLLEINKKYGTPKVKRGIFVFPEHYLIILIPFFVFFVNSIRSGYDLKMAIGNYIEKIYARLLIWEYAIKNKMLII